jgi:hypothetical protein
VELKYVKEAKARGLHCGVSSVSSSSSSSNNSSSYSSADGVVKEVFNSFNTYYRTSIQKYLKSKGYYNSIIDGKWGKNTKSAINKELGNSSSMNNKVWVNKELLRMFNIAKASASSSTSKSASNLSNSALCEKATFYANGRKRFFNGATNMQYVKEAKTRGLTCGHVDKVVSSSSSNSSSSSSNTSASNQKKKNWLLLGILGAAAIASGNGDAMATGFLQGLSCGISGNNGPCNNAIRRVNEIEIDVPNAASNSTSNLFNSGVTYKIRNGKLSGDDGSSFKLRNGSIRASDGKTYKVRGNKIRELGGTTSYKLRGDTLRGSDGTRCKLRGNKIKCR